MCDAYWKFFREVDQDLKDKKVKFDEPFAKVRYIAELWKKEKKADKAIKDAKKIADAADAKSFDFLVAAEAAKERAKAAEERAKVAEEKIKVAEEFAQAKDRAWEDTKRFGDDKMKAFVK